MTQTHELTNEGTLIFTLTIAFVILKLLGVLDIAWVWVFIPVWLPVFISASLYIAIFALQKCVNALTLIIRTIKKNNK